MITVIIDEVAAQKERMALGERQTETETFGEVVDFDKRLENQLLSFVGQAWTHILNGEENEGFVLRDMQRNMLAVRVFGSIVKQFANGSHQVEAVRQNMNLVG